MEPKIEPLKRAFYAGISAGTSGALAMTIQVGQIIGLS
jgi:hypothetical protein